MARIEPPRVEDIGGALAPVDGISWTHRSAEGTPLHELNDLHYFVQVVDLGGLAPGANQRVSPKALTWLSASALSRSRTVI
jgi:hypothetical protein